MKIEAYCTENFLDKVYANVAVDHFNPVSVDSSLYRAQWIKLIERLHLNLDLDSDEDFEKAYFEKAREMPWLRELLRSKHRDVSVTVGAFRKMASSPESFFMSPKLRNSLFPLFMGIDNVELIEREYGFTCVRDDDPYLGADKIFEQESILLKAEQKIDYALLAKTVPYHHSVIIADPYLVKNLSYTNNTIADLIKMICGKGAKSSYHFTYLGGKSDTNSKGEKIDQLEIANRIREVVISCLPDADFSAYNYKGIDFHNRWIFTNACSITSGPGFSLTDKNGEIRNHNEWEAKKPWAIQGFGSNTSIGGDAILEHLRKVKEWIGKGEVLIEGAVLNPLLTNVDEVEQGVSHITRIEPQEA